MVFERAIPVRESIDARSGDGPDGRRRIGRTPAEGDVGTDNAPRAPPHASLPTQPDEGRDPALGEGVATADRSRQQTGGESRLLAAVAPDRHCDLRRVQAAAPRMQSSRRPGRRDRVRGEPAARCPTKATARRLMSASRGSGCASSRQCSRPPRATRQLSACHCASGVGGVSDGPAPRKQSCARRWAAAICVIQMSPKQSLTAALARRKRSFQTVRLGRDVPISTVRTCAMSRNQSTLLACDHRFPGRIVTVGDSPDPTLRRQIRCQRPERISRTASGEKTRRRR